MILLLTAALPGAWPELRAAEVPPAVASELDRIRQEQGISALALVVVDRSRPAREDAGLYLGTIAHDARKPVQPRTVFRIGSITKSFTGLLMLRLTEQGQISPAHRLREYVPDSLWRNPWPESPVTLAQLLEHSAGFSDMSRAEFDDQDGLPLGDALRRYSDQHIVRWQPGLWSSYSNLGAGLAGLAMERAVGVSYEELVRTELLGPLGMADSGFERASVDVTGYDSDGRTVIPYWNIVYPPAGALNASSRDMARYVRFHLDRGTFEGTRLLSRELMARAEEARSTLAARHGLRHGYGLGNYAWYRNGFLFHGHGGDADGYLSRFAYSHDLAKGYFLVINAFQKSTLRRMRSVVENWLTEGASPAAAAPALEIDAAQFGWLEGDYRRQSGRFSNPESDDTTWRFRIERGVVRFRADDEWSHLYPVAISDTGLLLRYPAQGGATAIILRDDSGAVFFVDDTLNLKRMGNATQTPDLE